MNGARLAALWAKLPLDLRRGLIAALGVMVAMGALGFWLWGPVGGPGAPRRLVTIKAGQTLPEVAAALAKHHLVRSPETFALLVRLSGAPTDFVPGIYSLSPRRGSFAILAALQSGEGRQLRLTVPEGFGMARIARLLDDQALASGSVFLEIASRPALFEARFPWLRSLPPGATLEGLLFPDTYLFDSLPISETDLVGEMLARGQKVLATRYARTPNARLSYYRTLTLASIVELEAAVARERPLIAGVFFNRLRDGMPLGSDPTVEYALGRHQGKRGLSLKDVRVESPYNTYRYPGLPPGPIGNPGLAAFEACLAPESTDLLYFVARGDGTHAFTHTYAEHRSAQARYRR